jgi:DNA-binding MarR family transcriptional regulator
MGPLTAGRLAELSGLTTGAITGVVDRLERAGWAHREADPNDRRRVIIVPVPQETPKVAGLYESYGRAISTLLADYDDEELAMILEFINRFSSITSQEAARMQTETESVRDRSQPDN